MGGGVRLDGSSHWPADTRLPVLETTICSLLREAAAAAPETIALVDGTGDGDRRRWTYRELLADAERFAGGLLARFEPGERLALYAPNAPEWIIAEYGAALAGLTLVTVNPALREAELDHVLRQSEASGLLFAEAHSGEPLRRRVAAAQPGLPSLRETLALGDWESWCPARCAGPFPEVDPADPAMIIFTSGTTGAPKGAILRHRGITNNYRFNALRIGMGRGDVFVSPIPLFHVGGACMAVLTALAAGATFVLGERISARRVLDLVESERAGATIGVPPLFLDLLALLDETGARIETLRTIMVGGATVAPELIRSLESRLGARVHNSYGQTECGSIVCATERGDPPEVVAETVGRPFPQAEVRIVGPDGNVLPLGEPGELCVRGYQVMAGYVGMPEATAAAIEPDGWLHTGDVATMDADGRVRIVGRLKEMIIRGGENLFPQEIEAAIRAHPSVLEVAVVGRPDPRLGETAAAFVQLRPSTTLDAADLAAFLRPRLAAEKIPEHWQFVEAFPVTGSGKIDKRALV